MHSRPLRQAVDLALDTLGMQGPITRRQVAEEVIRSTTDDCWSYADQREARIAYLQREIADRMAQPVGDHLVQEYLPHVPAEYRTLVDGLPRFICVTPRGGRDSQHVMSIFATADQWAASYRLKDKIAKATENHRDRDRSVHLMLQSFGAATLVDLFSRSEAAQ